jgi:hypothetical protein
MGIVEFDEGNNEYTRPQFETTQYSGLTGFIIKTGVAKTEGQARGVLLAIITTCFILSIIAYVINLPPARDTSFERKFKPGSPAVQL